MPRVSEAHLAARRQQILDAATRCFARNGIHQTSMQDVIKEAGLSVGAFYRYFSSKAELIQAIGIGKVGLVLETLDRRMSVEPMPPLEEILEAILEQLDLNLDDDEGPARIAVQVWGQAVHDAELRAVVANVYGEVRAHVTKLAQRAQASGQLPADTDAASIGAALFGLMQGYILQRLLMGNVDRASYIAGVSGLLRAATAIEPGDLPVP
jgi:AcrR family transcriptional regulator